MIIILWAALSGNYCNFGVFELYGDPALADALDIALKMTLSIPLADILTYRKVCVGTAFFIVQMLSVINFSDSNASKFFGFHS